MCWPTPTSIFPPWSAPLRKVQRGNAKGNARSTECSPLASTAFCGRGASVQYVHGRTSAGKTLGQCDLHRTSTGGGLCRPSPRPLSAIGATTQRGRERPPSEVRQVPSRLTLEGRSRPRCAPVDPPGMRPVVTSPNRHVMRPAFMPPVGAPRAWHAGGTDPVNPVMKEPVCH
jgi:hypothetical protein